MSGNKVIVGFGLSALLGAGLGFAIGIAAFPFLFPPPEVNEQLVGKSEADVVARATFIHAIRLIPCITARVRRRSMGI